MKRLAILGAGSWGTALAIALSRRFECVRLWSHDRARAAAMEASRINTTYLPGFDLPPNTLVSGEIDKVVADADALIVAVPSQYFRPLLEAARPSIAPNSYLVSATKGIEEHTLRRMSEIANEVLRGSLSHPVAVLSGPTFAKEIAAGEPAAVVIASDDANTAEAVQRAFATDMLRLYGSSDVTGVELGAALKNVIAIGAGLCDGLGLGSNSVAALITRGLVEMSRLVVALGGQQRTMSGLAGLGDLVLTATGNLSRNRYVGMQLGQGRNLEEILSRMSMVAEGVRTCRAARALGLRTGVDLPIVNQIHGILYESKNAREAIKELMERPLGGE